MNLGIKKSLSIFGVIVVSIASMFILASFKSPPQRKPPTDNRPTISIMEIQNSDIHLTVPVIGRLSAHDKVNLLAEVSGVLEYSGKEFLSGQSYQAGEVMLRINQEETELNLKAKRSGLLTSIAALLPELKFDYPESFKVWNEYLNSFDMDAETQALPTSLNDREKYFVANKGIYNTYYSIKAQEARLKKYTLRAPFDGVLIKSNITPGNLVMNGQVLGTLINPNSYDLETSISIDEVNQVYVGDTVELTSANLPGTWTGYVSRIIDGMDAQTQMVKVFISVSAPELKDQMFLSGNILTSTIVEGVELPRKMLYNGTDILMYVDGAIQYQPVSVVSTQGETAVITGLENGTIISQKTQGLFDGTEVKLPGEKSVASQSKKTR